MNFLKKKIKLKTVALYGFSALISYNFIDKNTDILVFDSKKNNKQKFVNNFSLKFLNNFSLPFIYGFCVGFCIRVDIEFSTSNTYKYKMIKYLENIINKK